MNQIYWLFAGSYYYPCGGMNDLQDKYTTLEEAIIGRDKIWSLNNDDYKYDMDWYQIVNVLTGVVVCQSEYQPEW